jgi:acyl-CoA dehydrogenase
MSVASWLAKKTGLTAIFDAAAFAILGSGVAHAKISDTEATALEAGDVGIEQGYFDGRPQWDAMRALPPSKLSAEEQAYIDGPVSELAARMNPSEISAHHDLPPDVYESIKKNKIWGMIIDKEHGGLGFSPTAHSDMIIKLGSMSATAAVTAMVPNSLGPGELLMRYGTEMQKDKWLPRLADGREIPCFALTSVNGGSDASGGMMNNGTVFKGEDGRLKVRMDISNRYITLAPIATLAGVAFKLKDPDNLLGKGTEPGITLALIPRDTPNLIMGPRHNPMDIPFQNGTLEGHNVVIDVEDNFIGGSAEAGNGWKMLMECLAIGRSISLPALSTAAGKVASQYVGSYARERRQFKTEISNFQGVDEALARIAGYTYIMDSARKTTLQMVEAHKKPTIPSAIIKYHLTEMMRTVCNDGMDVMAGSAVMNGPRNVLSELYKATPIAITVEGANIMTRTFIIFGQGLMRAHPNLYPMIKAAKSGDKAEFGRLFRKHGADVSRYFAASELGIGDKAGIPKGAPKEVHQYYKQINHLSAGFALTAAMISGIYQDKLKSEEDMNKRLGDVLSNLYLATSVLNHFEQDGMRKEDLPLVHWASQHLLHNVETAFNGFLDNLPKRSLLSTLKWAVIQKPVEMFQQMVLKKQIRPSGIADNYPGKMVAGLLRDAMFGNGAKYKAPSDALGRELAKIITSPNETKERLTAGIYRPAIGEKFVEAAADGSIVETPHVKPQALIEEALSVSIATEPLEAKLGKALKAAERFEGKGGGVNWSHIGGLVHNHQADDRGALLKAAFDDGVLSQKDFDLMTLADRLRGQALAVNTFTQDMRPL